MYGGYVDLHKIALITFSCIRGMSPEYIHIICRLVASVKGRAMLKSANHGELIVALLQ